MKKKLLQYDIAITTLLNCLKEIEPTSEIMCEIAENFVSLEKYSQAIFFYECACNTKPNIYDGQFVDLNYYYLVPYLGLTMLYFKVGNFAKAKEYHMLAKKSYPTNKSVIFNDQFFK